MFKDAYLVTFPHDAREIPPEFIDIASDVRLTPDATELIYRDPLTAYKVAAATGGRVYHGNVLPETVRAGGLHFPGGHTFLANAPRPAVTRKAA